MVFPFSISACNYYFVLLLLHLAYIQFSACFQPIIRININKLAERKYSEKFVQKLFAVIYNENWLSDSEIFFLQKFNVLIEIWCLILSSNFLLQWYTQQDITD